jgi:sugar/nucleoside kinase (ribokinase family)
MEKTRDSHRFLCIGDLVADIFSSPIRRHPKPGEQIITDSIAVYPGGNALNTAIVLNRLGNKTAVAGSVGDDLLGSLLVTQLTGLGLNVAGVNRAQSATTASTIIFRRQGEDRRLIHSPGIGQEFTGRDVSMELIPNAGIVLVAGYLKLGKWDDDYLKEYLRESHRRSCRTVLNVSILQDSSVHLERTLGLLDEIDVFVLNEQEARVLTGESDPCSQARNLLEAGAGMIIITRGKNGLYATNGMQNVEMGIFPVKAVDPTGCGDCFIAGISVGLSREWELIPLLEFASALGALGATAYGCTNGIPPYFQVLEFMDKNKSRLPVRISDSNQ